MIYRGRNLFRGETKWPEVEGKRNAVKLKIQRGRNGNVTFVHRADKLFTTSSPFSRNKCRDNVSSAAARREFSVRITDGKLKRNKYVGEKFATQTTPLALSRGATTTGHRVARAVIWPS